MGDRLERKADLIYPSTYFFHLFLSAGIAHQYPFLLVGVGPIDFITEEVLFTCKFLKFIECVKGTIVIYPVFPGIALLSLTECSSNKRYGLHGLPHFAQAS
ncbi:MAG: hypothetical protein KAU14_09955, partial [Thermoplasmata archaeon]|nr:hypothetical protein [Thermoplasmata archaeon]